MNNKCCQRLPPELCKVMNNKCLQESCCPLPPSLYLKYIREGCINGSVPDWVLALEYKLDFLKTEQFFSTSYFLLVQTRNSFGWNLCHPPLGLWINAIDRSSVFSLQVSGPKRHNNIMFDPFVPWNYNLVGDDLGMESWFWLLLRYFAPAVTVRTYNKTFFFWW